MRQTRPQDSHCKDAVGIFVDIRPFNKANPMIETDHDVDQALAELAKINAKEAAIQEQAHLELNEVTRRAQAQMVCDTPHGRMVIADRRDQLLAELEVYAKEHRAEVLEGLKGKSRDYTHGTIKYRDDPDGIGAKAADNVERLDEKHTLTKAVRDVLRGVEIAEGLNADQVIDVSMKPAISRMNKAVRGQELTIDDVKAAGFRWEKGREQISIIPKNDAISCEITQ
jgi:phage host-nuclease inhibitor protein Gam